MNAATRDIRLLQTRDLNATDTTKHGSSLEQRRKIIDKTNPSKERPEDARVEELEGRIRKLGKQSSRGQE